MTKGDISWTVVISLIMLLGYIFFDKWIWPMPCCQPIFNPLRITCVDCGYKNETRLYDAVNKAPNSVVQWYWNEFENCPECGKKNWTVESIPQPIFIR